MEEFIISDYNINYDNDVMIIKHLSEIYFFRKYYL